MMTLYHCRNARSFRPLWALEELGLPYDLKILEFPPRVLAKSFLDINPLGTVPLLIDRNVRMTESAAICQYLSDRAEYALGAAPDHPDYGALLNWVHFGEATLTFPQTLILRYAILELEERRNPQIVTDYSAWVLGRLRAVDERLLNNPYLCTERFTIADISVGYALMLASIIGLSEHFAPQTAEYWNRLQMRDGFRRAAEAQDKSIMSDENRPDRHTITAIRP